MTKISNDYYLPQAGPKISTTNDNGSLGKDAFLQILITQLQNQDPTSPMDDREFIAQMAQFSSLEQMQNMTKAMENLLSSQQETQLMSYTNFIGKEVKWHELTEELDENKVPITLEGTGVIKELKFSNGEPLFVLADGKELSAGNISSVLSSSASVESNPIVAASQLIGKSVKYNSEDGVIEALIESILTNKSGIQYILNNGTRLTKDQFELVG
jgi:flagellar basal-body rod modification protein FlgD